MVRIALANIRFPASPEESVAFTEEAIAQVSAERADLICFPERYVPGYRGRGKDVPQCETKRAVRFSGFGGFGGH
jgi:predicted amidohydrolase